MEAAVGVKQASDRMVFRHGPTFREIKMDPHSQARHRAHQPQRMLGGGHIGHNSRAGKNTLGMRLCDGLVHSLANAEIVRIYYYPLIHLNRV